MSATDKSVIMKVPQCCGQATHHTINFNMACPGPCEYDLTTFPYRPEINFHKY